MKNKEGITLVALVITIIVLLILAGVSISLVIGDNGIVSKSKTAKRNTVIEQARENIRLAANGALTKGLGVVTYDNLVDELNNIYTKSSETNTSNLKVDEYILSPDEPALEWTISVQTTEGIVSEVVYGSSSGGIVPTEPTVIHFTINKYGSTNYNFTAESNQKWSDWITEANYNEVLNDFFYQDTDIRHLFGLDHPTEGYIEEYMEVGYEMRISFFV